MLSCTDVYEYLFGQKVKKSKVGHLVSLAWGRYRRHWFKTTLTVSLQFHHAQLDGRQAALFLERLQKIVETIRL